jgi:hypothetical protein
MAIPPAPQNREISAGAIPPARQGRLSSNSPRPPLTVGTCAQGLPPMHRNPDTLLLRPPQPQNRTSPPIFQP